VELLDARERVRSLEQRPVLAVARALPQRGRRCVEVDNRPALLQPLPVLGTEYDSASGGQNDIGMRDELFERGLFPVAEAGLAFQLENDRNRNPEPPLELDIRVVKQLVQAFGKQTP